MVSVAWATDKGTQRETNQDACCVQVAETAMGEVSMAVMCDGVGGLSNGERASSSVVRRFASWFRTDLPGLLPGMQGRFEPTAIRASWGDLIAAANEELRVSAQRDGAMMGTTLTGVIACAGTYLVAHVGDCRLYRVGRTGGSCLTKDQTLVARLLEEGVIEPEEAATHPGRNVILQAVGVTERVVPAFVEGAYAEDDLFVLCSDGAYGEMDGEDMRRVFGAVDRADERELQRVCYALLGDRMNEGTTDNLSVACVCPNVGLRASGDTVVVGAA